MTPAISITGVHEPARPQHHSCKRLHNTWMEKATMSGASALTIAGRSGGSRGDDRQPGDLLGAIADMPSSEQDRLLREHGEAVADHMANHFARLRPHLAASSGFAR